MRFMKSFEFYRIFLGFMGFFLGFMGFSRIYGIFSRFMRFFEIYGIFLKFMGFFLGFIGFFWDLWDFFEVHNYFWDF